MSGGRGESSARRKTARMVAHWRCTLTLGEVVANAPNLRFANTPATAPLPQSPAARYLLPYMWPRTRCECPNLAGRKTPGVGFVPPKKRNQRNHESVADIDRTNTDSPTQCQHPRLPPRTSPPSRTRRGYRPKDSRAASASGRPAEVIFTCVRSMSYTTRRCVKVWISAS